MQGTLILAILSVKSSYSQDAEEELEGDEDIPDTLQWWIGNENAYRLKTFALDHDIHVYVVRSGVEELVQLALKNNSEHYADKIEKQHVLQFMDCQNTAEVQLRFSEIGLSPRLEVVAGKFAFWKPDEASYSTRSKPVK